MPLRGGIERTSILPPPSTAPYGTTPARSQHTPECMPSSLEQKQNPPDILSFLIYTIADKIKPLYLEANE